MATRQPTASSARKAVTKARPLPTTAKARAQAAPRIVKKAARRPVRSSPLGEAGSAARDGVVRSLQGLVSIEAEVAALVRKAIVDGLNVSQSTAKGLVGVVRDVVSGAIQATEQNGSSLAVSIKGLARGVVMGVHDARADVVKAASETVKLVVKHAGRVGADVELVVRRAMDGITEAVTETGGNVTQTAKAVAAGALRAARKVGSLAERSVAHSLERLAVGLGKVGVVKPAPTRRTPVRTVRPRVREARPA